MKKIYIVSTYTGTVLSYIIKNVTKVPYAHVSIAFGEDLGEMYSFGRKHVSNPIFAGFVREYINGGLYKKQRNTQCKVYSVEVSDIQYSEILSIINDFYINKNKYTYDVFALFRLLKGKSSSNKYKFVCSQFVAYVFEASGCKLFDKTYSLVTPKDFYESNKLFVEYEGLLREYSFKQ